MNRMSVADCENLVCRAKALPLLYAMGRTITEGRDLRETTSVLLKIMEDHLGVLSAMLTLYHRNTGTIFVHESLGLTDEEKARGVYNLGEGITGKVVDSGKAIVVPKIGEEPNFLGRTRSRHGPDSSFLCIPICRGRAVLGTISVEKLYASPEVLDKDVELLTFIASIMAQTVELYLLENEERTFWESENRRLQEALKKKFHPSNIIGNSPAMREVYALIEKIARTRVTVLLLGESGVGKELVANAIHYSSACSDGPFVKFNCAALPESLIESELFGHEKGAFTGADTPRKGRFEEADGGTIFLDEVGELPLLMQSKLLRVLQEKTFERVGASKPTRVNIRILAATNRDLKEMVAVGKFREDLYYRLNVLQIVIPPLRDRGSDIVTLCDHFIVKFAEENNKVVTGISTPAKQLLANYSWPGNVRELENVIERAVVLCDDEVIHGYNLPPSLHEGLGPDDGKKSGLEAKVEAVEYEYLVDALKNSRGNMTHAAEALGMTRRILGLRMKKYNLDPMGFRTDRTPG
jgi:Nif-specific regulatory protein